MIETIFDSVMFKGINVQNVADVQSKFKERYYSKNQVIFYQGDIGNEMYIIKTGCLKIFREDDSKQIIFGHQFPGEMIGELECVHLDNHRLASVATIENSILWMINKADLEELIDLYPQILRKLFYVVSERLQQADRKLEYLAFLDARVRVINLLLDLYANFGVETEDGFLIDWKITQIHFANMIGIGRESAARILQELQNEQIITVKNKIITIINLEKLKQMENQQYSSSGPRNWHPTYKYDIQ